MIERKATRSAQAAPWTARVRRVVALIGAAAWVTAAAPGLAQPAANLNGHRAAVGPEDGFSMPSTAVGAHLELQARLQLDYSNDPLVHEGAAGFVRTERVRLVSDQLRAHPSVALGLFEWVVLYTALPVDLLMIGEPRGDLPSATGRGVGDLRLGARGIAVRGGALRLALQLEATLPTGAASGGRPGVAGDAGATAQPEVIGELALDAGGAVVALGARFRQDTAFADIRFRDVLLAGLALYVQLVPRTLIVRVEGRGETPMGDLGERLSSRLDGLLGLEWHVGSDFTIGGAGGAGFVRGYGEPDVRVVLLCSYRVALAASSASGSVTERAYEVTAQQEGSLDTSEAPQPQPPPPPEARASSVEPAPPAPLPVAPPVAAAVPAEPAHPAPATTAQWIANLAATPKGDADGDRVPNGRDRCPLAPGRKTARGCPKGHRVDLEKGTIELLQAPRFRAGAAAVEGRMKAYVDELATTLRANPTMRIALESHTTGDDADAALALSRERAASVRAHLMRSGVAPGRVQAYGCGQNRPIAPGNVPWGRKKNDRLEVHLLDPVPTSGVHSMQGCLPADTI